MSSSDFAEGHVANEMAAAVARRSYGKLVAFLAARTRDLADAEDALSDAFASALTDWPKNGCPANPEAWLLTAARRKIISAHRREQIGEAVLEQLQTTASAAEGAVLPDGEIPDRRLALLFACAHPAIEASIHAPLMLQTVLGLDAKAIASAFLMSPAAMGKRLVRAKNKIKEAGIPFGIPERHELAPRLDAVMTAIYTAYAEGWSDPGGIDPARRDLTAEALFLARLAAELMPEHAEAHGLLALMLHTEARRRARRNERGEFVSFADQDLELWDWNGIREAELALRRAYALGAIGRFQLEAAVQSAHVYRRRTGEPNWSAVVQLYDALLALTDSPVISLNRALALAEAANPKAGLDALAELSGDSRLREYQPYWAAQAELLAKTGAHSEAARAYEMAIGLERDPAVRKFLRFRQSSLVTK